MRNQRSSPFLLFIGLVVVAGAGTTPLIGQGVANWEAPPFWSPPEPQRPAGQAGTLAATTPLPFIAVTPCRVVDTRGNGFTGDYGPPALSGNGPPRSFAIPAGPCSGIPGNAGAYSINVAAILPAADGFLTVFPTGAAQPASSDLNFLAGEVVANAIVAPAGSGGAISVYVNVSTHMILDINGYYAAASTGIRNTFLGFQAGNPAMTGEDNTGLGLIALSQNTTGGSNIAVGTFTLPDNTIGSSNTALGGGALRFNGMHSSNTGVGVGAQGAKSLGGQNTAAGYSALVNGTGTTNTALGFGACSSVSKAAGNNICIGSPGVSGDSNTIRIGSGQTATFVAGINGQTTPGGVLLLVNSDGKLGTTTSSRRFKEDIQEIAGKSDGLMRLRPVAFTYKRELDPTGLVQYGLIAEEVAEVYPDLVAYGKDGQPEAVRYQLINALLLNERQKQHRMIEELESRLAKLEALLTDEAPVGSLLLVEEKP
ncbi:MAG TPA: tail fiber domain-containing protein [Thermoanaerobaculia bacterium]